MLFQHGHCTSHNTDSTRKVQQITSLVGCTTTSHKQSLFQCGHTRNCDHTSNDGCFWDTAAQTRDSLSNGMSSLLSRDLLWRSSIVWLLLYPSMERLHAGMLFYSPLSFSWQFYHVNRYKNSATLHDFWQLTKVWNKNKIFTIHYYLHLKIDHKTIKTSTLSKQKGSEYWSVFWEKAHK